jgi:hypothetical protein
MGDVLVVHALLDEAYRAWDSQYVPQTHDDWLRWMTGDVEFDPTVWWLAERDGELVGCALYADNPTGAVQLYERLGFVTERREGQWASSL